MICPMRRRLRPGPAAAVGVLCLLLMGASGCSPTSSETESAPSADEFPASCPDEPVFDRNLDLVTDSEALPTPEAAVLSVVGPGVDVVDVIATSPGGRDVEVRAGGEVGTFVLRRRDAGWLVKSGEGCAAWPAGRVLLDDDEDEAPTGGVPKVTRADVREIQRLFDQWSASLAARDYAAMCAAQTAAFNADVVDYVRADSEDRVGCATALVAVTADYDQQDVPLTGVGAHVIQASVSAQGTQGSRIWAFAREGGAWRINCFPYASDHRS